MAKGFLIRKVAELCKDIVILKYVTGNQNFILQEFKFVIGDNSQRNGFLNPPLDPNKDYKIYVRVESEANGKKTVNCALVAFKGKVSATTQQCVLLT